MSSHDTSLAELEASEHRSSKATAAGAHAFAQLLKLAEERDSGQIVRVVRFIAATGNGKPSRSTLRPARG